MNAWGGFYLALPWPKRDVKKAAEYFNKALAINPYNLRARVLMAQLNLREDRPALLIVDEDDSAPDLVHERPETETNA